MDEEHEEDEGMTITFLKNKHFHIPSILSYQIKNRFQICRQKQHGDPRRHPQTENRTSQQCVCAVVESLADAFVVMKSEEKQLKKAPRVTS